MDDVKKKFFDAYNTFADPIYRHCFFRIFSKARAEELMQETFMRLWKYMSEGNTIENIKAFIYRVANNLIIDEARKKKEQSLDAMQEQEGGTPFEPSYDERPHIEQSILLKEILEEMEQLPSEDRELLVMRFIDDLDPKDIADILGISANNASVKINRALKSLRAYMIKE